MTDRRSPAFRRSWAVLRHRDYRLLWSAEILATGGNQMMRAALAWQLFEPTRNPLQLGFPGLARFVPLLVFGLWGGVLADRGDRRRTLLAVLAYGACILGFRLSGGLWLSLLFLGGMGAADAVSMALRHTVRNPRHAGRLARAHRVGPFDVRHGWPAARRVRSRLGGIRGRGPGRRGAWRAGNARGDRAGGLAGARNRRLPDRGSGAATRRTVHGRIGRDAANPLRAGCGNPASGLKPVGTGSPFNQRGASRSGEVLGGGPAQRAEVLHRQEPVHLYASPQCDRCAGGDHDQHGLVQMRKRPQVEVVERRPGAKRQLRRVGAPVAG